MLSRLISLLNRIPAVKWAFNRLRPLPHSGSIDVTPSAADEQPVVAAITEAAPTVDTSASEDSFPETSAEAEPAAVEASSVPSVEVASEPIAAPELISSDPPVELLANVEPDVVEEVAVSSAAVEAIEPQEPVISSGASSDDDAEVAPDVAEQAFVSPVEVETVAVSESVIEDQPASIVSEEIETVDETPAVVHDNDIATPAVAEVRIDNEPAPDVVMEIEPVVASDPAPVAADVAEDTITDAPVGAAEIEPPPAPAPKKIRPKVVEPADRAALIRQRWAETGIRMWNPRLHGTGEATLNIQGRIGLLPPEPGETMPRYDKLEFRMLGGQVACEGVIVEAPVHAGQRSFTRLAEPRSADRSREPVRERQAALA
ncbi:hypothetical protein [Bradyrhizobium sp. CCBAU 11434]|uniref:hypothetical protein n=1 Tax=Bradyrhizobium sp. CCBAU 11434 TaxID=1630885 RepID=UPI002305B0C6|nr:hypothetical protein [Bradyrhizobium sp. CCBAU 11434]